MNVRFLSILICITLISLVGCGKQNEAVETAAQVVADAFEECDMATINEIIFGTSELEIDEELSDVWGETIEPQEGVLEYVFEHVTVKVKKITDSVVEYEVEAPDMEKVFGDIETNEADISEGELLEHIGSYVPDAETKETTVLVEYIFVDDEPILNYQDEEFINAVTGGLLDAYKTLYLEMIEEYAEGRD